MSRAPEVNARTEIRDGMRVTWHQPIAMNDGLVLRADVYRPIDDGCYPVVLTYGIYAKGLEIVTSCIAVPAGWRVALIVRGKDYEYEGALSEFGRKFHYGTRGTSGMTHNDLDSRPPVVFGGRVTLHAGGPREAYLLLPVIPPSSGG
jgi:uncharacterized protein